MAKFELRSLSYDMAANAIEDGTMQLKPRTADEQAALTWMESAELAKNSVLLQTAVTASTTLSEPARVKTANTTWSKRQSLVSAGWSQSSSGRGCSARGSVLNAFQGKEYYNLLLGHRDSVIRLEERNMFSHAQGVHYYTAVKTLVENADFGKPDAAQCMLSS